MQWPYPRTPQGVDVLESLPQLETIREEWASLWRSDPHATVFQSPEWLIPWTRYLWRGGQLRVLTVREDGRLLGVIPLFLWGERHVSWLGAGVSDYLGITAAPGQHESVARVALQYLSDTRSEWDECRLEEQRHDSPFLCTPAPGALVAHVKEISVCPVRWLAEPLPTRIAKNVRSAERKLTGVQFVEADWPDLFRLHQARWGGEGVLSHAPVQAFHREAATPFVRLYGLRVDGEMIAVEYNLIAKDRACYYLSGWNPSWASYSPGSILLRYAMEEASREGARVFDFLRQGEAYKYAWGARDQINRALHLTAS